MPQEVQGRLICFKGVLQGSRTPYRVLAFLLDSTRVLYALLRYVNATFVVRTGLPTGLPRKCEVCTAQQVSRSAPPSPTSQLAPRHFSSSAVCPLYECVFVKHCCFTLLHEARSSQQVLRSAPCGVTSHFLPWHGIAFASVPLLTCVAPGHAAWSHVSRSPQQKCSFMNNVDPKCLRPRSQTSVAPFEIWGALLGSRAPYLVLGRLFWHTL